MTAITVTTYDALQEAAARSRVEDVEVEIHGLIQCKPELIDFGGPGRTTVLRGGTLQFGTPCDWEGGEYAPPGIRVRSSRAYLSDVDFVGYEGSSAAQRFDVPTDAEIVLHRCTFSSCGRVKHATNPRGEKFRTQCIACHTPPRLLKVERCSFFWSCTNEESLSHCIYATAQTMILTGNNYHACGNPWGVNASRLIIVGEKVYDPLPCWCSWTKSDVTPRMLVVNRYQPAMTFAGNTIKGNVRWLAWGAVPRGVFAGNDYSGMNADAMAWDYDRAKAVTLAEWRAMGLDV